MGKVRSSSMPQAMLTLLAFATVVSAQCDRAGNSCYNALFPCNNATALANAIEYCSTVGAYDATNYPPQATAVCGTASKAPYIAACQCPVSCPPPTGALETTCSTTTTGFVSSSYPGQTMSTSSGMSMTTSGSLTGSLTQTMSSGSSSSVNSWTDTNVFTLPTISVPSGSGSGQVTSSSGSSTGTSSSASNTVSGTSPSTAPAWTDTTVFTLPTISVPSGSGNGQIPSSSGSGSQSSGSATVSSGSSMSTSSSSPPAWTDTTVFTLPTISVPSSYPSNTTSTVSRSSSSTPPAGTDTTVFTLPTISVPTGSGSGLVTSSSVSPTGTMSSGSNTGSSSYNSWTDTTLFTLPTISVSIPTSSMSSSAQTSSSSGSSSIQTNPPIPPSTPSGSESSSYNSWTDTNLFTLPTISVPTSRLTMPSPSASTSSSSYNSWTDTNLFTLPTISVPTSLFTLPTISVPTSRGGVSSSYPVSSIGSSTSSIANITSSSSSSGSGSSTSNSGSDTNVFTLPTISVPSGSGGGIIPPSFTSNTQTSTVASNTTSIPSSRPPLMSGTPTSSGDMWTDTTVFTLPTISVPTRSNSGLPPSSSGYPHTSYPWNSTMSGTSTVPSGGAGTVSSASQSGSGSTVASGSVTSPSGSVGSTGTVSMNVTSSSVSPGNSSTATTNSGWGSSSYPGLTLSYTSTSSAGSSTGTNIQSSPTWSQTSSVLFPNSTTSGGTATSGIPTGTGSGSVSLTVTNPGSSIIPSGNPPTGTATNSTSTTPISSGISWSSYPASIPTISLPTNLPPGATCTPNPINTGILDNGDFETGLSPWSLDLVDLFSTTYALEAFAGANASCTSFVVSMLSNPQTQDLRENLRLRSDLVFSLPGAILRISFYVRFAARNAARLVLWANEEQVRVVSAFDFGPGGTGDGGNGTVKGRGLGMDFAPKNGADLYKPRTETTGAEGEWTQIILDYTARDRLLQLTFSYQLASAAGNTIWLDQVSIIPRPSLALPSPPSSFSFSSSSSSSSSPPTTLTTALRSAR